MIQLNKSISHNVIKVIKANCVIDTLEPQSNWCTHVINFFDIAL